MDLARSPSPPDPKSLNFYNCGQMHVKIGLLSFKNLLEQYIQQMRKEFSTI